MIVLKGKVWKICKFKGGGDLARIRGIGVFEGGGGGGGSYPNAHYVLSDATDTKRNINVQIFYRTKKILQKPSLIHASEVLLNKVDEYDTLKVDSSLSSIK